LAKEFSQDELTGNDDEDRLEFGPSSLFTGARGSNAAPDSGGLGALYKQPSASPALSARPGLGLIRSVSADEAQFLDTSDVQPHQLTHQRASSLDAMASSQLAAAALPGVSFARTGASFVLNDPRDPFTKLSVSFAFAQSARLSVLENQLEDLVETIRPIPEAMAQVSISFLFIFKNSCCLDCRLRLWGLIKTVR
jgi:hypothetical protein